MVSACESSSIRPHTSLWAYIGPFGPLKRLETPATRRLVDLNAAIEIEVARGAFHATVFCRFLERPPNWSPALLSGLSLDLLSSSSGLLAIEAMRRLISLIVDCRVST